MRLRVPAGLAVLASLGALACGRNDLPPADSAPAAVTSASPFDPSLAALRAGGVVTAAAPSGRPRFIRDVTRPPAGLAGVAPDVAAREHFARFAPAYGISGDAVARLQASRAGRTPAGDHLVRLRQLVDGIEVYRGDLKVLMRADLSLVALSGTPSDLVGAKPEDARFLLRPGQALQRALEDLYGGALPEATTAAAPAAGPPDPAQQADVWLDLPPDAAVQLSGPARARPIYYREGSPGAERLVAAYSVEFFASAERATTSDAYRYLLSALDGRVFERHNLTADAAFRYRVFADATGDFRPLDGPVADYTPHPTGLPDGSTPEFVAPALVAIESLKSKPAGAVDPWLSAAAVQTLGNNVDAYADLFSPDGYSNGDLRATTTAPGTFDRSYDTAADPGVSAAQTMAATTNLFFLINWLHDYWYDSGFDEAAGNAQNNNFGRGGAGGDAIRAEAQDSGGLNNANMSTPGDGLAPRMQMYLWTPPEVSAITVEPGALELPTGTAGFGPQEFDVSGDVVLADDGTAPTGDACQPLVNDVAGRIVLLDRGGTCGFAPKVQAAEQAGAVAVIVANNVAGPPPGLGRGVPPVEVGIPSLSVSLADGDRLKQLLAGEGGLRARLRRDVDGPGRDGSLDNMIVAHEWGHYFHHRLSDCNGGQCGAMSEGWGDFLALHTALREGDNLDGTYGAAVYAPKAFGDSAYFGIRRFPYSVDFSKNALTFKHIQNGVPLPEVPRNGGGGNNAEVHNAGEVWCSMLLEAYVGLHKAAGDRSFAAVRRAFSDYVVLGLQLAPPDATFTETRDAILIAASQLGPGDLPALAGGFARRGAGTCAVSPGAGRTLTENFSVQPGLALRSIQLDDAAVTCDGDGILDGGETGRVQVEVTNPGPIALADTTITLATDTAGVSFPDGTSVTVPSIDAYGSRTVSLRIALDPGRVEVGTLALTVTAVNAAACTTSVEEIHNARIHADEKPGTSTTEDVESIAPPWGRTGTGADGIWSRVEIGAGNHAWKGINSPGASDTQLVTPPLKVSAGGELQVAFDHAYRFEASATTLWDGGVIELSTDDGATWRDVSTLVDPGYTGTLAGGSGNPLAGRPAYSRSNATFPSLQRVSLAFGTALAGQTVRLRFRIGTDLGVGGPGWTIDNIAVSGIDNLPFTTVVPHTGNCQVPPVASAGPDRTVRMGADVILDGSASQDPNGDAITHTWSQLSGPPVTILNPRSPVAAFRAPLTVLERVLTFQLTVADAGGSSTDTVDITVRVRPRSAPGTSVEEPPVVSTRPSAGLGGATDEP
jgi:hypothetical protein